MHLECWCILWYKQEKVIDVFLVYMYGMCGASDLDDPTFKQVSANGARWQADV